MKRSEVSVLCQVAKEAGSLLRRRDRTSDVAHYSGEKTTRADVASEMFIRDRLERFFPSVSFFGEETQEQACRHGRLFIVDPIDGTGNYLMGDPFWGVSIALVEDGQTSVGVIELPELKRRFCVTRRASGVPSIHVSRTSRLKGAHVWFDANWTNENPRLTSAVLQRLVHAGALPQIRRCCTASMMWVAAGKLDAFIHTEPKPFDIAAAGLIVEKAGGRVSNLDGTAWDPFSSSVVASNNLIHEELLAILA